MSGKRLTALACVLILFVLPAVHADSALQTVTLQLKWKHQFQFAGYYAAWEKGLYRKAGLDVRIVEGGAERPPIPTVVNGSAEYGVSNTQLLLARSRGAPVVVLAAIIQHSPLSLVVRRDSGIISVKDLYGRKLMIGPDVAELLAYFKQNGLEPGDFIQQRYSQNVNDLINGNTDGLTAYTPDQPYVLEQAGIDYFELRALDGGIDFYGDVLFTTEQRIKDHPEQVKAFRLASLAGWDYAMKHPDEIAELIHRRYAPDRPLEHLLWEARHYRPFIMADMIELGHMSPRRWRHIADTYADLSMMPKNFDVSGILYNPDPYDFTKFYPWLAGGTALLVLLALFSTFVVHSRHKLRVAKLTLDKLVRNAPGMTYQFQLNTDGSSCLPFASEGISDVFGIDADGLKKDASAIFALIHPDDIDRIWQSIRDSAEKMTDWNEQFRVFHPNKGEIWLEGLSNPERLADGGVIWHGFVHDITGRVNADRTLRNSEQRFRQMFEHFPAAYQSLDIEGCYLDLNDKTAALLGYNRNELMGRFFGDFWLDKSEERFSSVFGRFKTARHIGSELQLRCKDGSIVTVLIDGRIQRDLDGQFVCTHCILWDITERKQLEEMLIDAKVGAEKANKAKSDFLSHMSHELRTPLNAVLGFTQLLGMDETTPLTPNQQQAVDHIMTSAQHLLTLINETLDLSRIESGNLEIQCCDIDLLPLIEEAVTILSSNAVQKQIRIRQDCQNNLLVYADPARVRQVLLNLLSNAIKYNRQGGTVAVSCSVNNDLVRVTVADTGIGIPEQRRQELFQPFQRLGAERTNIEGTGIGLVLCKRLVEAMRGSIGFESKPGIGTRFWFELPNVERIRAQYPLNIPMRTTSRKPSLVRTAKTAGRTA